MRNILIAADVYPPEVSSAAHLMQELAEGLKKRGHNVWVVTSYPKHYLPKEFQERVFDEFHEENGVKIIRVKILPLRKVNFIIRVISQLLLPFLFFRKIKEYVNALDAAIVYSPPLPLALIGGMVKRKYGAKFILNLQDIFPQNAIDLGVLKGWKHKPAIWVFERIERKVYKTADRITFHSEGGRRFLIEKKGVPEEKIVTIHNWVDIALYQNLTKNISFRKQWGLENKFLILFAGIIGPAQGMEFIADVAQKISDMKDIIFLLVGDGMEKEKIEKLIKKYDLKNMIIKPFVSKEEYPYLIKDADVGLVCLSSNNKTSFVPGKFLGYMAAAKPVLAFLNKESDGFALIEKAKCGYATTSEDVNLATKLVKQVYVQRDKLKEIGENGFKYANENLALDVIMIKIEALIS